MTGERCLVWLRIRCCVVCRDAARTCSFECRHSLVVWRMGNSAAAQRREVDVTSVGLVNNEWRFTRCLPNWTNDLRVPQVTGYDSVCLCQTIGNCFCTYHRHLPQVRIRVQKCVRAVDMQRRSVLVVIYFRSRTGRSSRDIRVWPYLQDRTTVSFFLRLREKLIRTWVANRPTERSNAEAVSK